jgi:hypothetical protein
MAAVFEGAPEGFLPPEHPAARSAAPRQTNSAAARESPRRDPSLKVPFHFAKRIFHLLKTDE